MQTEITLYESDEVNKGRSPQPLVYTYRIYDNMKVSLVSYYRRKSNRIGSDILESYNDVYVKPNDIKFKDVPFLKESREKAIDYFKSIIA